MRRLELKAGGCCGRWTLVEEAPKSNLGTFATEKAAAAASARERYRLEAPAVPSLVPIGISRARIECSHNG
jgi:hypothetical protein